MSFGTGRSFFSIVGAAWIASCAFPEYKVTEEDPLAKICTDGKISAAETGTDCGGGCPPCDMGQPCRKHADCASESCVDNVCQMPSCDDDVKNGTETDRDCGGSCTPCRPNDDCLVAHDCDSSVCTDDTCQSPTCGDSVQNGTETGIDCGGGCDPCGDGMGCTKDSECQSQHCIEKVCVAESCGDGVVNGQESDLDCGGKCNPCQAGDKCGGPEDCASHICEAKQCTAYSCNDGVKNGEETTADCGGHNCKGCQLLQSCEMGSDCESGVCLSGYCVPSQPSGTKLSRTGWQAKSSDTYPDDKPNDFLDSEGGRWTSGKNQYAGMWIEVDMQKLQTFFQIILDCTEQQSDVPARFDVYLARDGKYNLVKSGLYGSATNTITFDTAQLAQTIKVVLTAPKEKWWSINELNVLQ